jgi:hypothetical protein
LCRFVETKSVDIELADDEAHEMLDLLADWRYPLSQAILDRCEFRKLSLPVWEISESFSIAILHTVSREHCASRISCPLTWSNSLSKHPASLLKFLSTAASTLCPDSFQNRGYSHSCLYSFLNEKSR